VESSPDVSVSADLDQSNDDFVIVVITYLTQRRKDKKKARVDNKPTPAKRIFMKYCTQVRLLWEFPFQLSNSDILE